MGILGTIFTKTDASPNHWKHDIKITYDLTTYTLLIKKIADFQSANGTSGIHNLYYNTG